MIDWDKPIKTRSGLSARVICRDRKSARGDFPVMVLIMHDTTGEEIFERYAADGKCFAGNELDLVNVPPEPVSIAIRVSGGNAIVDASGWLILESDHGYRLCVTPEDTSKIFAAYQQITKTK